MTTYDPPAPPDPTIFMGIPFSPVSPKGNTYHKSQDDGALPLLAKELALQLRSEKAGGHASAAGTIFGPAVTFEANVDNYIKMRPVVGAIRMRDQAEFQGKELQKRRNSKDGNKLPQKQEGETSFVNYADASKSYDSARETLGCDIILGSMVMSPMNKPLQDQHLFDSGCGTGNYVASLMGKVGSVTMSDFSEGMLEKARVKFAGIDKIKGIDQADSCDLPYPDASFDAVVSNQVVQHIETDETRPGRLNLRTSCQEAYRVLKPGGSYIISTRSKEPSYDHLYWYSILAPKAVAAMTERVPSREQCAACLEEAGFTVAQAVTPKYTMIMNKEHYYDPKGVFSEAWRRGESWWSLVDEEELASLQAKVAKMIDEGTADAFIKERDILRCNAGQTLFISGYKPL